MSCKIQHNIRYLNTVESQYSVEFCSCKIQHCENECNRTHYIGMQVGLQYNAMKCNVSISHGLGVLVLCGIHMEIDEYTCPI